MKKKIKMIYSFFTTFLVLGAVTLALLLAGVRVLGFTPYTVLSGSMEPAYPVGSLIYVKAMPAQEIKVGDPITFVLNEDLVVATHRVIKIDEVAQNFYTKGDANESADAAPVYFKNLLGRPMFHIPGLGYVSSFLSTKKGMVVGGCSFIFIMLLLFFPELLSLVDEKEEKSKKKSKLVQSPKQEVET